MPLDLVPTLCDLVAIPSCNPMGRPLSGPEYFEARLTDHLQGVFTRLGVPWVRQFVEEKRDNIVARLDGAVPPSAGGQVIMLEAHQDTVPVDGMIIEPWNPVVRDGRVYGRGSCDIKGGMAAMLTAFSRLAAERPAGMPTVIMACTVNEEHGFNGAAQLNKLWSGEKPFIPAMPTACVVAEPTLLDVVVAHKGAVRWKITTRGKACHSSQPHLGDNAVFKMAKVIPAVEAYQRDVAPTLGNHALCGRATLSLGTISGGLSVNTVPDFCTIEVDHRLIPGGEPDAYFQKVVDHIKNWPGIDFPVEHEYPWLKGSALTDANNGDLAERVSEISRRLYNRGAKIGVPFGTDASRIAPNGIPCVVFGPGDIAQAHTVDEWVAIEQLEAASHVYYEFAKRGV